VWVAYYWQWQKMKEIQQGFSKIGSSQKLTLLTEMEEGHPWPVVEEGKMEGLSKIEISPSPLSCLAGLGLCTIRITGTAIGITVQTGYLEC